MSCFGFIPTIGDRFDSDATLLTHERSKYPGLTRELAERVVWALVAARGPIFSLRSKVLLRAQNAHHFRDTQTTEKI